MYYKVHGIPSSVFQILVIPPQKYQKKLTVKLLRQTNSFATWFYQNNFHSTANNHNINFGKQLYFKQK